VNCFYVAVLATSPVVLRWLWFTTSRMCAKTKNMYAWSE